MLLNAEVIASGGISAAANRLGVRKSTVSRRLDALESRLGVRLLERTTRRLRLTEAGREYHAQCARLVAEARAVKVELSLAHHHVEPLGADCDLASWARCRRRSWRTRCARCSDTHARRLASGPSVSDPGRLFVTPALRR